jgi:tripartite-type tricarboxylate transporter receptor subunit TctC
LATPAAAEKRNCHAQATPPAVINRLNAEVNETLKSTEVKANLDRLGFEAMIMSPQEFAAFLAGQAQTWPPVTRAANIQPQ